jgi:hypothetical protein
MIIAMNPKLSSPVTSKMMNQVLSWSPAVLIRADPERTCGEMLAVAAAQDRASQVGRAGRPVPSTDGRFR